MICDIFWRPPLCLLLSDQPAISHLSHLFAHRITHTAHTCRKVLVPHKCERDGWWEVGRVSNNGCCTPNSSKERERRERKEREHALS